MNTLSGKEGKYVNGLQYRKSAQIEITSSPLGSILANIFVGFYYKNSCVVDYNDEYFGVLHRAWTK